MNDETLMNVDTSVSNAEPMADTPQSPPKLKLVKRRGRKTSKIRDAFDALTTTPVLLTEHAREFDVSENILRQAKRFDGHNINAGKGRVRVRKLKVKEHDDRLYIYRIS